MNKNFNNSFTDLICLVLGIYKYHFGIFLSYNPVKFKTAELFKTSFNLKGFRVGICHLFIAFVYKDYTNESR